MKLSEARLITARRLAAVSEEAGFEALLMLSHVTGLELSALRTAEAEISPESAEKLEEMTERRLSREPLQYLLGEWYFMGLPFFVGPEALIPRQDTETLCEEAAGLIAERGYETLLDICTGTGCVAVSLAKLTGINTEASDISPACVRLALRNAERNGADIKARTADLFEGAARYDIITANPPYISDEDMMGLAPELAFEPRLALSGGADGLDVYRRIAEEAARHLNPGGALVMEVGQGEAGAVADMFPGKEVRIVRDLNGVERVVIVTV